MAARIRGRERVRRRIAWAFGAIVAYAGVAAAGPPAPSTAAEPSGPELYRSACLACHGPDGRGLPPEVVGRDLVMPDFSDCAFATREADADWAAVVHEGGPARGFSERMPAFGDALSPSAILRSVDVSRDFCAARRSWPQGDLNFPRPFFTAKAFPEDELVVSTSVATEGDYEILTKVTAETRLGARGQLEAILPFAFLQGDGGRGDWTGGIGDLVVATKWALLHSVATGSIFSAGLEGIVPTGSEDRGLGGGVWLFEPFLAYGQALPHDAFVQLHVGGELSTEPEKKGHEVFWRLATGMSFFQNRGFGRAWTPMVEVLGVVDAEAGAVPSWDVVPQLQVALPTRQHILLSVGARIPVDHFAERPIYALLYLLWDFVDGGLAEGW